MLRGAALSQAGRTDEALTVMQAGIDGFRSRAHFVALYRALGRKVEVLGAAGRPAEALAALREQHDLSLQLFRGNRALGLASLQVEQQVSERERRIMQLSGENSAQRERLAVQRLEQRVLWLTLASVAVLAVLLGLLLRNARRQREALWRDALTGAYNRHYLERWLAAHPRRGDRTRMVVLVDLDEFKAVNDRHGHATGDEALRLACRSMRMALQDPGEIFRWGGEEFLLVLDVPAGNALCDRRAQALLRAIAACVIERPDGALRLSASLGCIEAIDGGDALTREVRWADAGLYKAKAQGRNRAIVLGLTAAGAAELGDAAPSGLQQLREWEARGLAWTRTIEGSQRANGAAAVRGD